MDSFKLLPVGDTTADVVNKLAKGRTHRDLYKPDVVDLTAEREYFRALRFFRTVRGERVFSFS